MTKEFSKQHLSLFEQIKQIDKNGNTLWSTRNLSKVLEYSECRHLIPTIGRGKSSQPNPPQSR